MASHELDLLKTNGSRKHVLNLVTDRDSFLQKLSTLLHGTSASVSTEDRWMPKGWDDAREARLETFAAGVADASPTIGNELRAFWLRHPRANTPNWDLASTCTIGDRRGLVLVEAKAHRSELHEGPKPLASNASPRSRENHDRIRDAIGEARTALQSAIPGINISVNERYQLANRITYAWWLASAGIPVILMYLGFTNDPYFRDPFVDDRDWQQFFRSHAEPVLPEAALGKPIDCGKGSFSVIVRSLPV